MNDARTNWAWRTYPMNRTFLASPKTCIVSSALHTSVKQRHQRRASPHPPNHVLPSRAPLLFPTRPDCLPPLCKMGDAQERIKQLQQSLSNARRRGFNMPGGGNPRNVIGGMGGLLLFGGGGLLLYNSLFNGTRRLLPIYRPAD